ncbi:DUF1054 domain-containing protein [Ferroacidibacillus organovorans]|uniref:Uncharacterized protein n=1 Tax=Ferroacidibacillus organovorans TaxID=1765683 RepID=A0A124IWE6_9BACL|nr:DUF1054 domain-containing protein [Ferroacidibacillus organovorans]KUO97144.1 hypothetical protein ATW55_12615 [Ferroacidibacillus organovorans]
MKATLVKDAEIQNAWFGGFEEADFAVFTVPGLEPRMAALRTQLRPKFEQLGEHFSGRLAAQLGRPVFAHVAKHARRKTNPPKDSWVAFSQDQRGYKKWPTFMLGMWSSHVFLQFGFIYESPYKAAFAKLVLENLESTRTLLPPDFLVYKDHMTTSGVALAALTDEAYKQLVGRSAEVKRGDLLFGREWSKAYVQSVSPDALLDELDETLELLCRLYPLADLSLGRAE